MGKNHCHSPHTLINLPISSIFVVQIQTLSLSAFPISYLSISPRFCLPTSLHLTSIIQGISQGCDPTRECQCGTPHPGVCNFKEQRNADHLLWHWAKKDQKHFHQGRNLLRKSSKNAITSNAFTPNMIFTPSTWICSDTNRKLSFWTIVTHLQCTYLTFLTTYHFNSHW